MKTSHRIVLSAAALAGAAALVLGLTAFNVVSEGPVGSLLEGVATSVRTAEHRLRETFVGPGRRRHLAWFEPVRADRARLLDPPGVLLGAYADGLPESIDHVRRLEQALDTTFPLVQIYVAWGDRVEHAFPRRIATTIWNVGSVPLITWEPWLATFDNIRHPFLPLREKRDRRAELRPDRPVVAVVDVRRELRLEVRAAGRLRPAADDRRVRLARRRRRPR